MRKQLQTEPSALEKAGALSPEKDHKRDLQATDVDTISVTF